MTRLGRELARDFPAETARLDEAFDRLARPDDRVRPENLRVQADVCPECGYELDECAHGRLICMRECWPNGCQLCIRDLEDDAQDAIFDGVRDAARDREERDG